MTRSVTKDATRTDRSLDCQTPETRGNHSRAHPDYWCMWMIKERIPGLPVRSDLAVDSQVDGPPLGGVALTGGGSGADATCFAHLAASGGSPVRWRAAAGGRQSVDIDWHDGSGRALDELPPRRRTG